MRGTGATPPEAHRVRDWTLCGLLWGAISMTNPILLLMAPVEGIWILAGLPQRKNLLRGSALALLSAVLCATVAAPWVIRNEMVFNAFITTRSNLGAEAAMALAPGNYGLPVGAVVPTVEVAPEHQLYAQMGELAYVRMRGEVAKQWVRQDPVRCLKLVLLRFYMFWVSVPHPGGRHAAAEAVREWAYCLGSITGILGLILALRRKLPAAGLFAWAVVLLPSVYYCIVVSARFRNPLEPIFAVLTVYLFQQAELRWGFTVPGLRRLWPVSQSAA